jgi:ABC-type transport system involved in cytochrome c biogenesis permease component
MNTRAIFAIIQRDLKIASKNKNVLIMTIVLTLVFFVLFPWLTALIPLLGDSFEELEKVLQYIPAGLQQDLSGLSITQAVTVYVLKYMLAPFFLMLPLMVASTIAADSFAGEKERKTLEALLYTPTTDQELFVAKSISGWLAALVIGIAGFVLYIVMANAAAWSQMHRIFFPDAMWVVLVLWVVPAIAGLGVGAMVLASSRAQGFQDANQIGGLVILPLLALFYAQIAGVIYFNVIMVILMGLVIWMLAGLLIWLGSRTFHRNRLLAA